MHAHTPKRLAHWGLWLLSAVAAQAGAEEVLQPRGKAAYEQHLKELQAKYGADTEALKQAASAPADAAAVSVPEPAATASPDPVPVTTERVAAPAAPGVIASAPPTTISGDPSNVLAAGSRVNVALTALGTERFRFGGEAIDAGALQATLERIARDYQLDTLVLLENEQPIQARHLVELSRLSAHFKIPALYQRGQTLLAVAAATP